MVTMSQYLQGGYKEDRDYLLREVMWKKMRGNGYRLLVVRLLLVTRRKYFTMRRNKHWNMLPRQLVDSPVLDAFKNQLDRVLGHHV